MVLIMVKRLQQLANLPELTKLPKIKENPNADLSDWIECCQLFKMDPDPDNQLNLDPIQITGLKSRLYPYQVFGTFWQMKNSRAIGGGFVGDEMGLGKTLSFFAFIVVERQLSMLWGLVSKERQLGSRKHHKSGAVDAHLPCPSEYERPYWISCPCSTSNPSSQMMPKPGLRLAVVPPTLTKQWMSEWDKHIEKEKSPLGMKLAVVHPPAFPEHGTPDVRDATRNTATKSYMAAKKSRPTTSLNSTEVDEIVEGQEKWLVLATKQYYYPWAKTYAYTPKTNSRDKKFKPSDNSGLIFGIAMVDECHENHFKDPKPKDSKKLYNRGGILYDLPRTNSPFIWGYSGTPLVSSPRGLEPILWSIEQRTRIDSDTKSEWETNEALGLSECTFAYFDDTCSTFDNFVKGDLPLINLPNLEFSILPILRKFLIRRTAESSWFGHALMRLKPHFHHDIALKANPHFDAEFNTFHKTSFIPQKLEAAKEVQRLFDALPKEKRIGLVRPHSTEPNFPTEWFVARKERIFATLPYLVNFALAGPGPRGLTFEREETQRWAGKTQYKQSLYYQNLDKIVDTSPKITWLASFMNEWATIKEEEYGETGKLAKRSKKLVIATQFDVVALVLQMVSYNLLSPKTKTDSAPSILKNSGQVSTTPQS